MSDHTEALVKKIADYIIKGIIAITAWFAIQFFNDIRQNGKDIQESIKALRVDVTAIKEQVIRMDDKVNYHDQRIKSLEDKSK